MYQQKRPPSINSKEIKINFNENSPFTTSPQSPSIAMKKRQIKYNNSKKNSNQLIQENHSQLLKYIDTIDEKVQGIIKEHQQQFLGAYKMHMNRVREEMKDIKKSSENNNNSQRLLLDKIDAMEKQLTIFREQSLGLFEKMIKKDRQIDMLATRTKQLAHQNKQLNQKVFYLSKLSRNIQISLNEKSRNSQSVGQEKFTPKKIDVPKAAVERPNTNLYQKSNSLEMRSHSSDTKRNNEDLSWFREKLQAKLGDNTSKIETILGIVSQNSDIFSKPSNLKPSRARNNFSVRMNYSQQSKKSTYIHNEILKQKSKVLATKNEYENIFRKCVEQVRRQSIKKNRETSLNFYKANSPTNLVEFKKLDFVTILEMFVGDDSVVKKLYEEMFPSNFI